MAGRPRKVQNTSEKHCREVRSRRRADISTVPQPQRNQLIALAIRIEQLVKEESANGGGIPEHILYQAAYELDEPPYKVLKLKEQFKNYHARYPNEPLANAFTPPLPGRQLSSKQSCQLQLSAALFNVKATPPKEVRRRKPILSMDELERDRISDYATKIRKLLDWQDVFGKAPDDETDKVAAEFGKSSVWIQAQVRHLRLYKATYPDAPDAEAFTPLPLGRQKGRLVPVDIRRAIELAYINRSWRALNGDDTVSSITEPITPLLVHSLVQQAFPEYSFSESTTWRVIDDYRKAHPAEIEALRNYIGTLQKVLPWINNKTAGVFERVQIDISPLSVIVDYNGIRCTVRAILIVDDYSDFKPAWKLIPSKKVDEDGQVYGVDYTARAIRELLAVAMLRVGKRFRVVYPDNGPQFSKAALGPYMQFLISGEEDPSVLVNRQPGRPRGGGNVENEIGLLRQFRRFRPGYITESEYRRSLKEMRKKKIRTFEDLVIDFDAFMNNCNEEGANGKPSPFEVFTNGPDRSLTLPALENLTIFACTCRTEDRKADPGGFNLDTKRYVAYRDDVAMYEALANAAAEGKFIPLRIFELGEFQMVFFSLDGGETWEFAVEKEKKDTTQQTQVKLIRGVEALFAQHGSEAIIFWKTLLESMDSPLVLNGLRRQPRFQPYHAKSKDEETSGVQNGEANAATEGPRFTTPIDIGEAISEDIGGAQQNRKGRARQQKLRGTKTKATKERSASKGKTGSRSSQPVQPQQSPIRSSNMSAPVEPTMPDDTDEFLRELEEELGDDR